MTAKLVSFDFEFPNFVELLEKERDNIQMLAAATLQTQRGMIFDSEGAFNGRSRWEPLKFRTGMILSRSGGRGLRGSIAPKNDGIRPATGAGTILEITGVIGIFRVTIGSSLIYAEIHDKGGVIKAKPGGVLAIPIPVGGWANDAAIKIQKDHAAIRIRKLTDKINGDSHGKVQAKLIAQLEKVHRQLQKNQYQTHIFRKKVTIPARPYTDWTDQDARELNDTLVAYLESIMTKA